MPALDASSALLLAQTKPSARNRWPHTGTSSGIFDGAALVMTGAVTLCVGGGMGIATIIERV